MENSTKTLFLLLAILVVAVTALGCTTKATGGGWFIDDATGDQCSFGFNAQIKENKGAVKNEKFLTGEFQFVDHTSGVRFHTKINGVYYVQGYYDNCAWFGNVDNDGIVLVEIIACDGGDPYAISANDYIEIYNYEIGEMWAGYLQGGNINAHVGK